MLGCWLARSIFYFLDTDFPHKEAQIILGAESVVLSLGVFESQMKCSRFSSGKINHNDRFFQ